MDKLCFKSLENYLNIHGGVRGIYCICAMHRLRFRCVEPQRATLVRVAFNCSNPPTAQKTHTIRCGFLWRSERDLNSRKKLLFPLRGNDLLAAVSIDVSTLLLFFLFSILKMVGKLVGIFILRLLGNVGIDLIHCGSIFPATNLHYGNWGHL